SARLCGLILSTYRLAHRIMTRMAKNTTELTTQVLPKSSAMWTTPLVSSSMNPAPRKNIRQLGRTRRTGAKASRMASESTATATMPWPMGDQGISALRKYSCGQSSLGVRSSLARSTCAGAILRQIPVGAAMRKALIASFSGGAELIQKLSPLSNLDLIASRRLESRSEEHTSELQSLRHLVCR